MIRKGEPESRPESKFICIINLTGKIEDKIVENEENFSFQLSDMELVQGLDMAIALMDVNELSEITVASRFAYGSIGEESKGIPPDATIIYTVELLSAHEETDLEKKSFESRKEIGNKKRVRGNYFFERNEYNFAIQLYRRALEYLDESEGGIQFVEPEQEATNAQLQELFEDRIKVYNNLAQAQIKIQAYDAALSSIDIVLKCQPNNVKALFRKAKILESKADVEGSIAMLRKAGKLDPENKIIQNELSRLILKSKREARREKDLYKKMLGQVQKLDARTERKAADSTTSSSLSDSRFKYWSYTLGSILVSIVGVAIYRYRFGE